MSEKTKNKDVGSGQFLGCPWCGSTPKLLTQRVPCGSLGYYFGITADLWCVNNKCLVKPQVSASFVKKFKMKNPYDQKESKPAYASLIKSKSKAIELVTKIWNTRKP
jgi:hypothetical protein